MRKYYQIENIHDFGGHLQIRRAFDGYELIVNNSVIGIRARDVPNIVAGIQALISDPDGKKLQSARQEVVDVFGAICFKADYDRACIIQQVAELAEAMEFEIPQPDNFAEEITADFLHF